MKLEDIGFYTLSNERVKQVNKNSPLWRCELILTDRCNFKCPYCRGLSSDISGDLPLWKAKFIVQSWIMNGLKNIRFSGGEPTLYKGLQNLIYMCNINSVEHIAISTNGSANFEIYQELINLGVNDFSISLDACCSSFGEKMSGGVKGVWEKVIDNIQKISKLTYVTVGIVITEDNINSLNEIILFADNLGVSDIRIISAAQYNQL
jgi:cyclic pyranopterin phosphate synthase